ncbi:MULTISPECIES: methylamine utilization protein [unclassified Caballeronia]|uniref:methylamine utilization protein n=1 Tax=unclassified Caballeronia TaxID=2646786 RepID=UPI0028636B87|nr:MULTISPECIES: methylamine utilization protein [unclassified Caballeronia]MDR5740315.1 methylamine utilization protein [Caballeronia sp. LZ016]MDR5808505.1 methylamine utilization protein [Caballeronia sp. LZ019]
MMKAYRFFLAPLLALLASLAQAASVHVQVVDQAGAPVADAVVYATPVAGKPPATKPAGAIIDQVKRRFVPRVSVVQTGASVTFPNKDNIEHDVYSFSPAKRFELNLYHGIPANPVVFDKPGLVVMGCNIHDEMVAYLLIVDTPWFAKTDAKGVAVIDNVPADALKLTAWHYRLGDPNALPSQKINAATDAPVKLALQLRAAE